MVDRLSKNLPLIMIWLGVCALLIFLSWDQISSGLGWGPDDQLRQLQLRDWLAGQSWFDTIQYRIGEPDSQPMHWPRWVELPLALFILVLKPLFGPAIAETVAMVTVPLIALGFAMWLVFKITRQLFDHNVAVLAAGLTTTAIPLVVQIRPMRIDHHGWQIVLALAALLTMFWPAKQKAGLVLGSALALWLSISLEGLPLSIAFVALLTWRWLLSQDRGVRLFWTLIGFLITSVVLYIGSQGQFDLAVNYCDAISPAHLLAGGAGAIILLPAIRLARQSIVFRLIALVVAGLTAMITLYAVAPQCMGSAFGGLDPLVRDVWYANVKEGLPIWHQSWKTMVNLFGGAIMVGLLSLALILRRYRTSMDGPKLFLLAYAFLWAFIVSLVVQRASAVAAAYALPLMAWIVHQVFLRAREISRPVQRILATASVIFLILPGPLFLSFYSMISSDGDADSIENPGESAKQRACDAWQSIERLNTLARANIVAPFNFGPTILALTPHSVLATSHHRNDAAMADQIRIFTSPPDKARDMLADRDIRYIVACEEEDELKIHARMHPDGLWAHLADNKKPDWLQPVHLRDSSLLVWRVVPKRLHLKM